MFEITVSAVSASLLLTLSVLAVSRERSLPNAAFALAALLLAAIEVSDRLSLSLQGDAFPFKRLALACESLLPLVFLVFSLSYSRRRPAGPMPFLWKALMAPALLFPVSLVFFTPGDFFYAPDMRAERILFLGDAGYWFYMGVMLYCLISLVNIELTFGASSGTGRWKMKFEVAGISAILAVLIFYFSQGLLYRVLNMNLMPVRSGVMVMACLLVGYSRLLRGNGVKVMVSRHVFYRSLALLVTGGYFLFLGLLGEGLRYLGLSFSRELTIFIAFAAGTALLLLFFSEQLRRKMKVYVNKHFYAHKYDYREEWLKFTGRLSSCRTLKDVEEVILTAFRETFDLSGASLYLPDKEKKEYVLSANLSMPSGAACLRPSAGMVSYFVERERVFNPLDGEYLPEDEEARFVLRAGAGLMVPLVHNHDIKGLVVFGRHLSAGAFTYEDYDLMKTFSRQAALSVANFSLSEELAETREIAAVARVASFVVHDLKNLTSSLSLLLENAGDYMDEPEFRKDTLDTVRNTVTKMKDLLQRLQRIPKKQGLKIGPVDLANLAEETLKEAAKARPGLRAVFQGASVTSPVDAEELGKVVQNLLFNALEATNGDGEVRVETGSGGGMAYIRVEDNGCGIGEEFIKGHLFKPFRTTKEKGLGIGLYQCRQIVEAHGGRIEVRSEPGKGAVFTVYLPSAVAETPGVRCAGREGP